MIDNIKINIDKLKVKQELGYGEKSQSNQQIEELIDEMIEFGQTLIEPRGDYLILEDIQLNHSNYQVSLGDKLINFNSQNIYELLEQQDTVALLTLTIGNRLEDQVTELFSSNQFSTATILDAVGSVATEATANHLTKLIYDHGKKLGLRYSTMRYSPGYGDLKLEVQPEILKLLEEKRLGISTTTSNILLPQKSITAIIGLSKNKTATTTKCDFNCTSCQLDNCYYI